MSLILRRAQGHRPREGGSRDYDVLDDWRMVGRINGATKIWWWELFVPTRHKSYGDAPTRAQAMAAFRAEYERWLEEQPKS